MATGAAERVLGVAGGHGEAEGTVQEGITKSLLTWVVLLLKVNSLTESYQFSKASNYNRHPKRKQQRALAAIPEPWECP